VPPGLSIGPLRDDEADDLFAIFADVVETGDGYPHLPPLTRDVFSATWGSVTAVIGARIDGRLVGAYYLKPNFVGRGAHIANAGYIVDATVRGRGVGRALVQDSIERAPSYGFRAIQFNLVFASNPARALYERLGWREVGRLPGAIDGDDALIYWREVG
jgi:GNAT superfamily N-acetyltransferase